MRLYRHIFALIFLQQILKIQGIETDDEDFSSGSGCFEIIESGPCDCQVLHDCLKTCSDDQCSLDLGDCYTKYIGSKSCKGRGNATTVIERPSDADRLDTIWLVAGSTVSVILVTAAVIMIALRKKTGCCKRKRRRDSENGHTIQTICYRPDRQNQESGEYDRILVRTVSDNLHKHTNEVATVFKEDAATASFPYQKDQGQSRQTNENENDYQRMPDTSTGNEGLNPENSRRSLHMYTNVQVDRINRHADDCYQTISDQPPSYQYVMMNELRQTDPNDSTTHSVVVQNHGMDTQRNNSDCYVAMEEPLDVTSNNEYTTMQESGNRKSDVYAAAAENVYYGNDTGETYANEPLKRTVIDTSSKVKNLNEDQVYEKMEF